MRPFMTETLSIPTNGIRLHAEAAGPADGRLVLLLHGFPENWAGWQHQIPALARSGLRVVAPDQRGYNLSDKPHGVAAYRTAALTADILGILDYLGRRQAVVIGHDWGGVVAWDFALQHPERVDRLVILNAPHPAAISRAFTTPATGQLRRSWYIGFFQLPGLPELLLGAGRGAGLRQMLRGSARPDTFTPAELRRYTEAWSQPGTLTGMINWYRALGRSAARPGGPDYLNRKDQRVKPPTLILWGEQDIALAPVLAQWSLDLCDDGRLVRFPEATHWVQHDEPERVNNRLLDFLEEQPD